MTRIVLDQLEDADRYVEAALASGLTMGDADGSGDQVSVTRDGGSLVVRLSNGPEVTLPSTTTPKELASVLRALVELSDVRRRLLLLDAIVENIPTMIFVKEATELRFERINRAGEMLLGIARGDLLGRTDHDFFDVEQAEFFRAKDREALEAAAPTEVAEEPIATPRGPRWLRTVKMAIREADGAATHLLGISEDITSKKELAERLQRTEEQLRQSQKLEGIGRLAGGIAHDFNNLLTVVLAYTSVILDDLKKEDPLRAELEQVRAAGERAGDLTRQLLAFSRQQVLAPRVLDLNETLRGMASMLRRLLGEDVQLSLRAASHSHAFADAGQLEQVVLNLAINARDAMPHGGTLTIETSDVELDAEFAATHLDVKPGWYVLLVVRDTGVGMDAATRARVFEPFFTTKDVGKGTGLGLSTVFGIVRQSGGTIWVYSEPGRGTTFKIYLPRASASASARSLTPVVSAPARGGYETILVVEDDEAVRTIVRTILRRAGYEVLEAQNGGEAFLVCEQHQAPIHLLLTDVVMPRMTGPQLATRLATMRPDMLVIYMSGYTDDAIVRQGVVDAEIAFLDKPITPQPLLRAVRAVLDAKR